MSKAIEASDKVRQMPEQPMSQMQAMVIPLPLFSQMIELIRGNVCHREADPILQQCANLKPQTVNFKSQE
jgi:hypothetical protein